MMKIEERVGELIFTHAKLLGTYNDEVIYILRKIQDDIKEALLHISDLDSLKARQKTFKEIDKIIDLLTEDRNNYNSDISKLENVVENIFK